MRKNLVYLIVVSLFMTFFASCNSSTSAKLIPEDAAMVVSIDIKGSFETIGDEQIENLSKELKRQFNDGGIDRKTRNKIDEIIEDPMSIGVDLLKPIYLSSDLEGEDMYIVGSIRNKDNFETTMEYVASETDSDIREEGDVKYIAMAGTMIMYDGKSFVMSPIDGKYDWEKERYVWKEDETADNLMALFEQKKSFADTKSYKLLESEAGLAKLIITPELFTEVVEEIEFVADNKDLAASYEELFSDMSFVIAMNVDKGKATLSAAYDAGKNKDKFDQYTSMNGTIEGSHLTYVGEDATFVAAANLDGQNIWNSIVEVLKSQYGEDFEELKEELDEELEAEYGVRLRDLVKSFDGDVTFVMDGNFVGKDAIPEFEFYVSTKDNTIAQLVSEGLVMEELSNNKWELPHYDYKYDYQYDYETGRYSHNKVKVEAGKFNLTYKNNASCLSFNEKANNSFDEAYEAIDKSLFKSKQFYARLNVQSLLDAKLISEDEKIKEIMKDEDEVSLELIESVDCIDIASEANRAELNLYTVDKTKTPVNILIDFVLKLI